MPSKSHKEGGSLLIPQKCVAPSFPVPTWGELGPCFRAIGEFLQISGAEEHSASHPWNRNKLTGNVLLRPRMLALHCSIWIWKMMWVRIYQVHTLYFGLNMCTLLHLALLCLGHCPFLQMKDAAVLKDSEHLDLASLCCDCSYNSIIK